MILNYGLKYDDFERLMATVPTIRKALPIREIRKQIRHLNRYLDGRIVGTTHDYDDFNRRTERALRLVARIKRGDEPDEAEE